MSDNWRVTFPQDVQNAHLAHYVLNEIGASLFGSLDIETNPLHAEGDETRRVSLHQIVDELDPTNRAALFEFARLLVVPVVA